MNRREFVAGSLAAAALLQAREAPAQANGVRILVFDTFGTVVDWRGSVIAEGTQMTTFGRVKRLTPTRCKSNRIIRSVISKSVMAPPRSGRTATM